MHSCGLSEIIQIASKYGPAFLDKAYFCFVLPVYSVYAYIYMCPIPLGTIHLELLICIAKLRFNVTSGLKLIEQYHAEKFMCLL